MGKVFLYTFGCKVNQYETQLLRERLLAQGYGPVAVPSDADIVVINTCTVTREADRQARQMIRRLCTQQPQRKIIVTGCYAVRAAAELSSLGPSVEVHTDKTILFASEPNTRIDAVTALEGHSRAFVKVQDGCDGACAYCIVPKVRSRMWSRPVDEAQREVNALVQRGISEIVLTGIHLGRYKPGLVPLLEKLLAVPGSFRLRLSSLEIREATKELADLIAGSGGRICSHLHLPLQSGADAVLRRMNRQYDSREFAEQLAMIAGVVPDAGITTDVIVGFPGETDDDFRQTCEFLELRGFSRLHVFPFSPREGTVAATFTDVVPRDTIRVRALRLKELDARLRERFWRRFIGTTRVVVAEGVGGALLTDNYIRLSTEQRLNAGELCRATIVEHDGGPVGRLCAG